MDGTASAADAPVVTVWQPQPGPQAALLTCPAFEVFYGGARGGGKTDGMLGDWMGHANRYGSNARGLLVRRELPQLDDVIARSKELFLPLGAEYSETKKTWTMPGGAMLRLRALERDADAEKYQGHSYTRVYFEELTNFPDPAPVWKLKATLRSAAGVPCRFRATGNPGGPGHQWVKARYIDPAPGGYKPIVERDELSGLSLDRVFIPAKVDDNPKLLESDPAYKLRIRQSGSAELVKGWLDGDWSAIEGAYFDCWSSSLILRPVELPAHWMRFRAFDWGSARPFSTGWWAVATEPLETEDGLIPAKALVRYREWYGASAPNTGLKLHAEDVAAGIVERDGGDDIAYSVADPSIFAEDGGPSIAERMYTSHKILWRPADNRRVPRAGNAGGWDQMRARMVGEDGRPMIYCFSTCQDSIRTIPALQHDPVRPEDLATDGEDHCFAAGTLVDTDIGPTPIQDLVPGVHRIWSAGEWRSGYRPRMTRDDAPLVRLRFNNGVVVKCTPDHMFMDCSGEWCYARDLLGVEVSCDQSLLARQFNGLTASGTIFAGATFKAKAAAFTALFGSGTTDRFQAAPTSTIRMMIAPITTRATLSALAQRSIWGRSMARLPALAVCAASMLRDWLLLSGMAVSVAGSGTRNSLKSTFARSWKSAFRRPARNVEAGILSRRRGSSRGDSVAVPVAPVRCESVESAGRAKVYCLTEPVTGAFTIEGGLIVHNCADEWRYACMSRPYTRPPPVITDGKINTDRPTLDQMLAEHDRERRNSERRL